LSGQNYHITKYIFSGGKNMLIEIGPRKIGRCELMLDGCTAKGLNIIKKVLIAKDGEAAWVCQKCMLNKVKNDHEDYVKERKKSIPNHFSQRE
jgi:hypothetical protein